MKRWFFENWGLKILAFFIAIALWANVDLRQVLDRRKMTVGLEYADIPAGLGLGSGNKTSVSILLIGNKEKIRDLDPDDLQAVVSLKGAVSGKGELTVRPKVQSLPEGVEASVKEIKINLEQVNEVKEPSKKKKPRR